MKRLVDFAKPKSDFTRNVLTLMTGTTIAQAIPVAISPILTRLYTPEDFGVFALYMSITSILSVIATGRYELAIMLPTKDEDAFNILGLSIVIAFCISFIIFMIVFIFNSNITTFLGNPRISNWLYCIPITVFFTGIYQSCNYWLNRQKKYKKLATCKMIQTGATASSNLGLGFGGLGVSGLITAQLLGQAAAVINFTNLIWKKEEIRPYKVTKLKLRNLGKEYVKFPTWNLLSSLLYILKENILIIALSKFFESSFLGFYFMGKRLLLLPSSIICNAFSDVFFEKISHLDIEQEIFEIAYSYFKKLFFIFTLPFVIFVLSLDALVPLVFGNKWESLSIYLVIMSFPIYLNFLLGHFSKILIVTDNQDASFYFHLSKTLIFLIILFFSIFSNISFLNILVIISIFEIIFIFLGIILIKIKLRVKTNNILLYTLTILLISSELLIY